jgi:hypothetical protein
VRPAFPELQRDRLERVILRNPAFWFAIGNDRRISLRLPIALCRGELVACPRRKRHICPSPPSTLISTPVMYEASCEAKNATAPATSSGCPKRFIGTFATISFEN